MDVTALEARTGWHVVHRGTTASTNDDAAALRDKGAADRTVVVAEAQSAGRGREHRGFASPPGGLYASLVVAPAPGADPAQLVAWAAVATAEAVEAVSARACGVKWPNDLWMRGLKVGGILLERRDDDPRVIIGVGVNVRAVPDDLPADVRRGVTALDLEAERPTDRDDLLVALLRRIDVWAPQLATGAGSAALERAWRGRLTLLGEPVRLCYGTRAMTGVLEDASLSEGLLLRETVAGPVWLDAALVTDLTPA